MISDSIEITVVDPCLETLLNPNGALQIPVKLNVPPGEVQVTRSFLGPQDSVSVAYGSGFNLCGSREYEVFQADGDFYSGDAFSLIV